MAESTTRESPVEEPDKYFKGKQWYSAKRGEWIGRNVYLSVRFYSQLDRKYIEGLTDKNAMTVTLTFLIRSQPGDSD